MTDRNRGDPLLIYVHIPFCTAKCTFCDWVTEVSPSDLRLGSGDHRRQQYIDALIAQIEALAGEFVGYVPKILYWGGGTASILEPEEAGRIMAALKANFDLGCLGEATLEASPETLTESKLQTFSELGFNRISIGLQSLDDHRLHVIGRRHNGPGGAASVAMAKNSGFDNINVDLISGFPGETVAEFTASLEKVLELGINHVSLYPYRPSFGTAMRLTLRDGRAGKIDLSEQLAAYGAGRTMLEESGLHEYALSHFGAPACDSDLAYFQLRMDWVGFGSGATSLLGQEFRRTRPGGLSQFLANPLHFDDLMPAATEGLLARFMHQALSTFEGADSVLWEQRTGMSLSETIELPQVRQLLSRLNSYSIIVREEGRLRLPREAVASSYIRMLFDSVPRTARTGAPLVETVLGGY